MARLVFWLIVVAGLAALASSAYLRYELAQPGVSGLSTALAGDAPGVLFNASLLLHGAANAALLALCGALAGFVAGAQGVRIGAVSRWLGLGAAVVLTALQAALVYFPDLAAQVGLMPAAWGGPAEVGSLWPSQESLQSSVGLTICFGGAAALLGLGPKRQVAALVVTVAAWGALVWFLRPSVQAATLPDIRVFMIPAAGVMLLALFSLRQQGTAAILLCGGSAALLASLGGQVILLQSQAVGAVYQDTYYVVAHFHFLMSLFGLFTLLAALVKWARPRLPGWIIPGLAVLLVLGQVATFAPQFLLNRQGMPRRYIDYPDIFALWNLISSIGALVMFLALITMLALIWVRRAR